VKKYRGVVSVKKLVSFLVTTAILAVSAFAAPVFADNSDKSVKGLWIEVPHLPKDTEAVGFQMNDEGVAAFTRIVGGGAAAIVVERLKPDDIDFDPEAVAEFVAEAENIDAEKVTAEALDDLTEKYTYPVIGAGYITGGNEDTRRNIDVYIFTDQWVFRLHTSIAIDYAEEYMEKVEDWLSNLKFRE
jgi:hypothetical protein